MGQKNDFSLVNISKMSPTCSVSKIYHRHRCSSSVFDLKSHESYHMIHMIWLKVWKQLSQYLNQSCDKVCQINNTFWTIGNKVELNYFPLRKRMNLYDVTYQVVSYFWNRTWKKFQKIFKELFHIIGLLIRHRFLKNYQNSILIHLKGLFWPMLHWQCIKWNWLFSNA